MGEAEPPLPAKDVQKLKDELKNKQPKESSVQIAGKRKFYLQNNIHKTYEALFSSVIELVHGSTVALKYYFEGNRWLGCAGGLCVGATCPRMFMFGVDWMRCWGEVFRMYIGLWVLVQ